MLCIMAIDQRQTTSLVGVPVLTSSSLTDEDQLRLLPGETASQGHCQWFAFAPVRIFGALVASWPG